jgi:hypothetical protein
MTIRNTSCNESNRFLSRMLAGLVIAITVVVGVLVHAVANTQAFA